MRKFAAARLKQQGEALTSTSKVTPPPKVIPKWKGVGKDGHLAKRVMGHSTGANQEDPLQKAPPPPRHGPRKGLITAQVRA